MSIQKKIEAWKKEGHKVLELPFEDGNSAFFSMPTRKQLKLIMSKGKAGVVVMTDTFIKNCYLGGDVTKEQLLDENDTEYAATISANIDQLLGTKQVDVKKH